MTTNPYEPPESRSPKPTSHGIRSAELRRTIATFVIMFVGPFAAIIAFFTTCSAVPKSSGLMVVSFVLSSLAAGVAYSLAVYCTLPKYRTLAHRSVTRSSKAIPSSASESEPITSAKNEGIERTCPVCRRKMPDNSRHCENCLYVEPAAKSLYLEEAKDLSSVELAPIAPQPMSRTTIMLMAPVVAIFLTCLATLVVAISIELSLSSRFGIETFAIAALAAIATVAVGLIATIVVTLRFYKWYERS
ncbi:hypothetical protein Psta_0031 [Pirellula staleyi DSM 6068]|uniref:Uncharacterized protein n=1 Tax=Pirellula staleyi (strain ATCC 27377 / DSM 6068 / ICPB 4128) TaxID=530564 RepID=D2QZH0_PIRSD|nr:hypothetical protein [Pirellula staleyi]ADB14728.1 hypothetical protein Psta_0031 [Pirellula staleyi DSM 6068]